MPSDGFIEPEVCVQHDFFVLSFQPFITIEYNDNDIHILCLLHNRKYIV